MRPGIVTLHGYGGGTFSARPALIPILQIGSAEFHNVAVLVAADKELLLTKAILGYPVTSALGRITFAKDGTLTVVTRAPAAAENTGAPIWTGYSFLLLSLNTASDEKNARTVVLDTGSLSTFLTYHYLAEHRTDFNGPPSGMSRLAGPGGVNTIPAYPVRDLPVWIGSERIVLNGPNVISQPLESEAGKYFGLIGQDVLRQLSSYTIDYRTMRLTVAP